MVSLKRKVLSLGQKVRILSELDKGSKKADVCREFGLVHSTVSSMWKNKDKILSTYVKRGWKVKRIRKPVKEDVDEALLKWFRRQRSQNEPISGPLLKSKAEQLAKMMNYEDFVCSNGWIDRFKVRHNIAFRKVCGERNKNDTMSSVSIKKEVMEFSSHDERICFSELKMPPPLSTKKSVICNKRRTKKRGKRSKAQRNRRTRERDRQSLKQQQDTASSSTPTDDPPLPMTPTSSACHSNTDEYSAGHSNIDASSAGPSNIDDSYAGPSNTAPYYEMKENRKFVNVAFFVKSLQNLNNHGGYGCNFSDMHISGETKNGWNAGIQLSCKICLTTVVVWMEDPDATSVTKQPPKPPTSTGTATMKVPIIAQKAPAKKRRPYYRKTPTPPPDPPSQQHFLVPLHLAKSLILSPSNILHQDKTYSPSHIVNQPFIKQEIIPTEDVASPSKNRAPPSSTQPVAVQLLFHVEPSESAQNSNTATRSAGESTTSGDTLGDRQIFGVSVDDMIVPDITPAEVLPVDLNLVKKEVEEESQFMEVNDIPSVRLVPMSETSLGHSKTLFATDDLQSSTDAEHSKVKMRSVMASAKTYARGSPAKQFASVSDTSGGKNSTVSSYPTFVIPQKVFQQVISSSKEDALKQTANGKSDNIVLNLEN